MKVNTSKNSSVDPLIVGFIVAVLYLGFFGQVTGAFEAFGWVKVEEKEVVWLTNDKTIHHGEWIPVEVSRDLIR